VSTPVERSHPQGRRAPSDGIAGPATLLGVGLGGFLDGIVLHQILQWHHMVSAAEGYPATTVNGLEVNTLWDGLFHAVAYLFVLTGLVLLWNRREGAGTAARSWRGVLGWALVGWGLFNLVEGVVDHHLLGIHHVRPGPQQVVYDLGFLALGGSLLLVGWLLASSTRPGRSSTSP
jgi:uncharacterized membrane protein